MNSCLAKVASKHDVLYLNTPWSVVSTEEIAALDMDTVASSDSALFMWVSTDRMMDAAMILQKWGYSNASVVAVVDASQPQVPSNNELNCDRHESDEEIEDKSATEELNETDESVDPPKKSRKTSRPKKVYRAAWWAQNDIISRVHTEQLWVAFKGEGQKHLCTKAKPECSQIVRCVDFGKRATKIHRVPEGITPEWHLKRPETVFQSVYEKLVPGTSVIEMFGSHPRNEVTVVSPCFPGGNVPPLLSDTGYVKTAKQVLGETKAGIKTARKNLRKDPEAASDIVNAFHDVQSGETDPLGDEDVKRVLLWVSEALLSVPTKRKRKRVVVDDSKRQKYGIAAPSPISDELAAFFGIPFEEGLAWTKAVSLLSAYIKQNDLSVDKKVCPDEPLQTLFKIDAAPVAFFALCKELGQHFSKKSVAEDE